MMNIAAIQNYIFYIYTYIKDYKKVFPLPLLAAKLSRVPL